MRDGSATVLAVDVPQSLENILAFPKLIQPIHPCMDLSVELCKASRPKPVTLNCRIGHYPRIFYSCHGSICDIVLTINPQRCM